MPMQEITAGQGTDFEMLFPESATEVDSLDHRQFVHDYLDRLRPVVIRGAVANWPAVEKWTPRYLQDAIGHKEVTIGTVSPTPVENQHMRVADLVDSLVDHPVWDEKTPYLTKLNIHDEFPELSDDVRPYPDYALPDRMSHRLLKHDLHYPKGQMELLFGGGGLGFPLHYDRGFMHAFIMQIYGEKDIVLVPYDQRDSLYISSRYESVSSIDNVWEPDFEKYPLLRNVRGFRVRLRPGDLVFVPCGWWHATRLPGLSIGATCNSITRVNWGNFRDFAIAERRGNIPVWKLLLWQVYLGSIGASCRLHETLFGR